MLIQAGGSVSGGGGYAYGSQATVETTVNEGYTFDGWFNGTALLSTETSYTFTVTESTTLTARFTQNMYAVTLSANPSAGGSVSGAGEYAYDALATVKVGVNTGYTFDGWYNSAGTKVSTDANYTFTVTGPVNLTAKFTANNYTVLVAASPTAGGSVSGGGCYTYGSSVTVKATTNTGYTFAGWYNGSTLISSSASYTFSVTGNVSLTAKWKY